MPSAVEGMVSLRGALVPVIDLAKYAGLSTTTASTVMVVTEYNGRTQGFLAEAVDKNPRLDWSAMGHSLGVDAYVPKFDPIQLAETLRLMLRA